MHEVVKNASSILFPDAAREYIILFLILILKLCRNLGKYRCSFLLFLTYEECKWHSLIKTSTFG